MTYLKTLCTLGVWLAVCSSAVFAQEAKIGFVHYQRITTESTPAKTAQSRMEQDFLKRQKDLAEQQNLLKSMQEKYERDAPTLSESQRLSRQKEFSETGRDFQRKQREYQEDLSGRRNEELQQLLDKATKAVKYVAESEKYDLVLQEAVYISPKHDITDKVLKILNGGK